MAYIQTTAIQPLWCPTSRHFFESQQVQEPTQATNTPSRTQSSRSSQNTRISVMSSHKTTQHTHKHTRKHVTHTQTHTHNTPALCRPPHGRHAETDLSVGHRILSQGLPHDHGTGPRPSKSRQLHLLTGLKHVRCCSHTVYGECDTLSTTRITYTHGV